MLQVQNIKKQFADTPVLKGVSFSLQKGQVLSVIGSSGSGKTTLLRCLNFLELADEGQILLDDEMIWQTNQKEPCRQKRLRFGLVFQNFNLFPQYTALQNVTLAPMLLAKEKEKKAFSKQQMQQIEQKAKELLSQVGLADRMNSYPCQLSGGQQQRVAIARALALEPDILCFDEPTSALDPELTQEVLKVILKLKQQHTTMIVVTHEMEFARKVSDQVIFMADGKIEEQGTPQQIFDSPQSPKMKSFFAQSFLS